MVSLFFDAVISTNAIVVLLVTADCRLLFRLTYCLAISKFGFRPHPKAVVVVLNSFNCFVNHFRNAFLEALNVRYPFFILIVFC
jgi:hypothetical protein